MPHDPARLGDRILIADGGWSSELQQRGLPFGQPSERAVLERRDLVEAIARDYLASGAQFLRTHTFAANAIAAEQRNLTADLGELNRAAADLVRRIAEPAGATVCGVLGPSGKIVSVGEVSEEHLFEAYAAQAEALAAGGADWLVCETFSEVGELAIAVRAARDRTSLPVVACLSFDSGPQRTQTVMGIAADACATPLEEAGADLLGITCGAGWQYVLPATVALRAHTELPLWITPSAGVPDLVDGTPRYRTRPEDFDEVFQQVLAVGPQIVGGCCGIGPGHIRRFAALTAAHHRRPQ